MTDGDKLAQMEWQKWYDALDGYFLRRQLKKIEKEGDKLFMNADLNTRDTIPSNNLNDIFTCRCDMATSTCDLQPRSRAYGYIPKEYTSDSSDGFIVDNTIIPKHIARRGRTTVVWWTDGSKTHVVLEEGKQDCGTFAAFCIAYAKRCFGSTSALSHAVDQADEERKNARARRLREEEKKARAEKRRLEQEHKRQERERFIRMHMDEMCLKREAHRRLDEEGH
jgi:hypothetical protein